MRLLTVEDTERLLPIEEGIAPLFRCYRDLGLGKAVHRPRTDMVVGQGADQDYWLSTMEGAYPAANVAAIRIRSDVYREVIRHGSREAVKFAREPGTYAGLVLVFRIDTAEPIAIIQDGYLQLLRVAGTSALAARYLARPDSRVMAVIGAGHQGQFHARMFAREFSLAEIRLFCRTAERRERVAKELGESLGLPVRAVPSAEAAITGADIVLTCTNSQTPVLDPSWIGPGTHCSAIRYYREAPPGMAGIFDRYVVHPREYGWTAYAPAADATEAGTESRDLYRGARPPAEAVALETLVAGLAPGRVRYWDRTVFDNHAGIGLQFAALGAEVVSRAEAQGVGRELPTDWFLQHLPT